MDYKKGFSTGAIIGIIAIILIVGGIFYYQNQNNEVFDEMNEEMNEIMEEEMNEMMSDENVMMEEGYKGQVLAGNESLLLDFNQTDYEKALTEKKLVVLYFYANWCPVCVAEFPSMQSAFNKLQSDDVIGFRVNYNDDETDSFEKGLAREFGVAYQHTKVILKDGERVLKSPEGWEEARYTTEINNLLN